jgi:hypothetical protein
MLMSIALAVSLVTPTTHDGRHDFDFLLGKWHTHYRLLRNRLVHDNVWYDCSGESVVRPFWGGEGNLEVGDLRCPPPRGHVEGMTLRMYDRDTHQWSLWWGTKKLGLSPPPQVGHFNDAGTGEFYADDTFKGQPIVVRFQWTQVKGLPHFEQAFSTDNGKTWETNWICDYTKS